MTLAPCPDLLSTLLAVVMQIQTLSELRGACLAHVDRTLSVNVVPCSQDRCETDGFFTTITETCLPGTAALGFWEKRRREERAGRMEARLPSLRCCEWFLFVYCLLCVANLFLKKAPPNLPVDEGWRLDANPRGSRTCVPLRRACRHSAAGTRVDGVVSHLRAFTKRGFKNAVSLS